ncbi:hypothetical protein PTTG_27325 [Puccinia triticina 1-1 BBBD Race 1]|uniref:CxC1-like cysteine cluster associated with KDZ transposases domain-containing protein n=1 Tax=Puccinia triticina (isolate 1-1 / race 1 (BBBD)) TaxID=630390 RepID=A0A180GLZ5_PUCT1|nr:hypothetical protein PTTG_27325 [Puccinia triticina 1-1 BBBD Race 1]
MPPKRTPWATDSTFHVSLANTRVRTHIPRQTIINEQARLATAIETGRRYGMLPRSQRPLCDRSNQPSHNSAPHALSNGNDPGHQHVAEDHLDALQPTLNHARFHRLRSYAEARERRTEEWAEIENQAAATYLYCQTYSSNWSTGEYPNEHVPFECSCLPQEVSHCSMDLIDIYNRTTQGKTIPSTTLYGKPQPYQHQVFFDMYSRILMLKEQVLQEGLQTTNEQKWASKCPQCFGPKENEVKSDPDEPDFIIAMDGNYQKRHYAYASKDLPTNSQYPPTFLPPSGVNTSEALCEATNVHVTGVEDPCALAHKVADDTRDNTTWQKCDDNGLFAGACQHNIPLLYANVYKSCEKLYYPISILGRIVSEFPHSRIGVLYDIGCQLETHIKKRSFFFDRQSDLMFGTSVFHSDVHEWSCQVKYNPRLNKSWGLSDGEGLERLWSNLSPLISSLRVSSRFHRLMAVHNRTLYYAACLNETTGELLLCKFNLAAETTQAARNALDLLNQLPNPYSETGGTYTNIFFQQQWDDERAYHLETTQSYQEKQKKELGHLLCLEEQLEAEWSWEGLSAAQGIARANIASRLSDQILEQRTKVGDPTILENLTDLRRKFLALIEEKQPLFRVSRPGEQTTLGTNGQQKLIKSVRKQAKALHKVLNKYTKQVHTFIRLFPDRTHPRPLEYDELLNLKSEDPFWNNGLFTNENQPWAVDPTTQKGIRHLAALRRGEEEQRRLGWEVRRAMRWALGRHDKLSQLIEQMTTNSGDNHDWTTLAAHPILSTLVAHPILQSLPATNKIRVARSLLQSELVKIFKFQTTLNQTCISVLDGTPQQLGDFNLCDCWSQQIDCAKSSIYSMIPGDTIITQETRQSENETGENTDLQTNNPEALPPNSEADEDEVDDKGHLKDISIIVNETMMQQLENETEDVYNTGDLIELE